ncbi:monomethylamine:corrinoid methyltransferase [Candidatus Formimonas warabiya]|uniref:Monomethylamine:corrinoid methyltransferase n=1 Tax=Formimonas warabiya TaxID=1761012 RepID=A0A3G1KRK3_FORW1|nr:monomethylamine:corrinoid methyltransferase [Candidatus Formimonas warabiya]ATW24755.1 hypothetical protein DCMF_08180 [Candidatus Formimonas warabiya]
MATAKFWEVISRGESGIPITEKEFDLKVFRTVKRLCQKYNIKFDAENLVPTDEELIDNSFLAAVELLLEVGVLNTDSGKVIEIGRDELFDTLRRAPSAVLLGSGKDQVKLGHRTIEDRVLPIIIGGCGNPVSDDIRYKIYLAYAMDPMIDSIEPLPPYKFRGMMVKAGTPFEIQACLDNISLYRKACLDAGRPGMPIKGKDGVSAIADVATDREDIGYRKSDHFNVYFQPTLKTNYESLNRVAHYNQYGAYVSMTGNGYVGGSAGPIEGAVISSIAEQLASTMIYNTVIGGSCVMETLYPNQTSRQALWGTNLASAAMNKHTHIPGAWASYITTAGPCTDMCLYEIAAATIGTTVMGNNCFGVAPNQGVTPNYCTPMESRFMGEVAYAATKIERAKANDIVKTLVNKYEERFLAKNPPKGKTFHELYDLDTLLPKQEYLDLHQQIWAELETMGLKRF